MIDLKTLDPATATGSPELVALIAEKWMGWETRIQFGGCCVHIPGVRGFDSGPWSPFTNPAHAGEARRKADSWDIGAIPAYEDHECYPGIECLISRDGKHGYGACSFAEVNDDEGQAEALAAMRAILAVLKARQSH